MQKARAASRRRTTARVLRPAGWTAVKERTQTEQVGDTSGKRQSFRSRTGFDEQQTRLPSALELQYFDKLSLSFFA